MFRFAFNEKYMIITILCHNSNANGFTNEFVSTIVRARLWHGESISLGVLALRGNKKRRWVGFSLVRSVGSGLVYSPGLA